LVSGQSESSSQPAMTADLLSQEFPCSSCADTFTRGRDLTRHTRTQHNKGEEEASSGGEEVEVPVRRASRHTCSFCGATYRKLPTLQLHIREDHKGGEEESKEEVVTNEEQKETKEQEDKDELETMETTAINNEQENEEEDIQDTQAKAPAAPEEDEEDLEPSQAFVTDAGKEQEVEECEPTQPFINSQKQGDDDGAERRQETKEETEIDENQEEYETIDAVKEQQVVDEDQTKEATPTVEENIEENMNLSEAQIVPEQVEEEHDEEIEKAANELEETVKIAVRSQESKAEEEGDLDDIIKACRSLTPVKIEPDCATSEKVVDAEEKVAEDDEEDDEEPEAAADPSSLCGFCGVDMAIPSELMDHVQLRHPEEFQKLVEEKAQEEEHAAEVEESDAPDEEVNFDDYAREVNGDDSVEDEAPEEMTIEVDVMPQFDEDNEEVVDENYVDEVVYDHYEEEATEEVDETKEGTEEVDETKEATEEVDETKEAVEHILKIILDIVYEEASKTEEPARKMTRRQLKRNAYNQDDSGNDEEEEEEEEPVKKKMKEDVIEDTDNFFDVSEEDGTSGFVCVKCNLECKDKSHLRNHILAHFYSAFDPFIPKDKPFACPECGNESRDKFTLIRHLAWTHKKFEEVTGLAEAELNPRRVAQPVAAGGTSSTRTSSSATRTSSATPALTPTGRLKRTYTKRSSRSSPIPTKHRSKADTSAHISLDGPAIILDDLSFDILEALKNVDDDAETLPKKRGRPKKHMEVIEIDSKPKRIKTDYSSPRGHLNTSAIMQSLPKSTKIMFTPVADQKAMVRVHEKPAAKKLLCSLCKNVFMTRADFDSHVKREHTKGRQVQSPTPPSRPAGRTAVKTPEVKLLNRDLEKCTVCKQKFPRSSLASHMESHQSKCDHCSYKSTNPKAMEMHKKGEHRFKCKCKAVLPTKAQLDAHTKAEHSFKCQKCPQVFEHKVVLEKHFRQQHYFKCTSCGEVSDSPAALSKHEEARHRGCEVCEDEFSWAEAGHSCWYTRTGARPASSNSSW